MLCSIGVKTREARGVGAPPVFAVTP